nr:MAG: TrkH family potassium uptake protein [Pseudomonadota bacterium]
MPGHAADFAWPLRSGLSHALLLLLTGIVAPWCYLVVRAQRGAGSPHTVAAWVFRVTAIALSFGFLGAKWWLLLRVVGDEPERYVGSSQSYGIALLIVLALGLLGSGLRFAQLARVVADHPARLLALSFGATGLFGAFALSLPLSMQRVNELSFVDSLVMAFSAVCVTGLSVKTIATTYTLFGQGVICALVQIGGLGIMVLSAAIVMLSGQRMRVRSSAMLAEMVDSESLSGLRRTVFAIVAYTLLIELAGATILYQRFLEIPEVRLADGDPLAGPRSPEWAAVFHAVSAFCNAGMSNFEAGLAPLVDEPVILGTITVLMVLGGIGFPVMDELLRQLGSRLLRRRPERLSLHTRVVLVTSGILLAAMTFAYGLLEWSRSFAPLSFAETLGAAIFQSAATRSAGFNVVDVGAMRPATLMLTCLLMFIGGSPGSCAGGIKTTTLAVLFAGLRSELRGTPPRLFDRALRPETIRRAMGVSFLSIGILSLGLFVLLLLEDHAPLALAFEAFSAFTTTGLSTGITADLGAPGKLLVAIMMYVGRIGPLTLALALSGKVPQAAVRLPEERVLIG